MNSQLTNLNFQLSNTIVALATPQGIGAIGVIRLCGDDAIKIADEFFVGKKKLSEVKSHTIHFGKIYSPSPKVEGNKDALIVLDEVVVSIFKNPHSYTGDDIVEISCHGSQYIIQQIIQLCISRGARMAKAGEFTQRAFLNGKLDLSQAESVADIIASENKVQLEMAFNQMRGGYSETITKLRNELIEFAALIELELDFSEEDVEFANREKFFSLIQKIKITVQQLIKSFEFGNVIKHGIPVAIVGEPNAGKSTLLNAFLNEEKAIVSDIAGTTRDFIEDTLVIDGIQFRFIDTAGIRETEDTLESIGIERSYQKLKSATVVLYLADIQKPFKEIVEDFKLIEINKEQKVIILLNKFDKISSCDAYDIEESIATLTHQEVISISAFSKINIEKIFTSLISLVEKEKLNHQGIIVTNTRHVDALQETLMHLNTIENGLKENISGDFLSIDIRMALNSLGLISGVVEMDRDVLGTIFGKFCIGK